MYFILDIDKLTIMKNCYCTQSHDNDGTQAVFDNKSLKIA